MTSQEEIKFLEYLDSAVCYEKDKLGAIKKSAYPLSLQDIYKNVDDFELNTLKTMEDCKKRIIANKVLKNLFLRRSFELLVRENFDGINFSSLAGNTRYILLKNKIIKNHPELNGVDDSLFLKQIANSIAHGNYLEHFKIDDLEKVFDVGGADGDLSQLFSSGGGEFYLKNLLYPGEGMKGYDENSRELIKNINKKTPLVKATPLQMYMTILEGRPNNQSEILKIKFDTSRVTGNVGGCDIELSFGDIDEILFFLISNTKQDETVVFNPKNKGTMATLPDENTPLQDLQTMLNYNDICLYSQADNSIEDIVLDDHQLEYFKNDYLETRKLFTKEYYESLYKNSSMADLLSTNNYTGIIGFSNMFTSGKLHKLSYQNYILSSNLKSYINFIFKSFCRQPFTDLQDFIEMEMKNSYGVRQIFETYIESLISETLLLLQIIEDKGLYSQLENNAIIKNIINSMDMSALQHFRISTKYGNDEMSLLKHMRNSFTHLSYLSNPDDNIYVYDRKSKKNRTPDYKFTINAKDLELIKNELFQIVAGHYPTKNINSKDKEMVD